MSVPRSSASPLDVRLGEVTDRDRFGGDVDLPQPDGPTTATNSPSAMPNVVRSSAVTAPSRVAYVLER